MPILLGGGGAFLFLIFVIVIFAAFIGGGDDDTTSSSTSYTPTYSYSYSSYSYSSYSPTSSFSSFSPTTAYTTESESPSTSSTEDSDGYGSPESNKVYDTGKMKSVGCRAKLPSVSKYKKYATRGTACLDKAWKAQLAKEGIPHRSPGVVVAQGASTSPCGGTGDIGYVPAAFYCGSNETMYFSIRAGKEQGQPHMFVTLAHEYGHHVENLIGISEVYNERYQEAYSNVSKRSKLTRRHELQAQCFAGLFVGQNYRTMGEGRNIRQAEDRVGDDHLGNKPKYRTHGKYRSNRYWYYRGFDTSNAGTCNAWSAPGKRVA